MRWRARLPPTDAEVEAFYLLKRTESTAAGDVKKQIVQVYSRPNSSRHGRSLSPLAEKAKCHPAGAYIEWDRSGADQGDRNAP